MNVPFVDLKAGVAELREEYIASVVKVLDSAYFVGGPTVDEFEADFAAFTGVEHAIAVSSGTDALVLALRSLGVRRGDEVITAPNSFFATAEAISNVGATPVFADVREDTLTIDPDQVRSAITERTRAIVPVHLFGQMADLEAIEEIAEQHGITVLEDAAQAHGAARNDRRAGSAGKAAAFSFYPAKNLGAFGEGGAITTNDAAVARAARQLRDHGQAGKHNHLFIGYNARLDAIKCACLSVSLAHLDRANQRRRAVAAAYRERLNGVSGVELIAEDDNSECVYHLFVVRVSDRDRVRAELAEKGIATAIHYPVPIHLQPAYSGLGLAPGSYPVAERAADEILSLPMYPQLDLTTADFVATSLAAAVA